tara:strand:- start:703 stop:810 length:108 start_codon:yes stop_codon:yes gene_type:complete
MNFFLVKGGANFISYFLEKDKNSSRFKTVFKHEKI